MSKSLTLALGDQMANTVIQAVTDSFGMTFGLKVVPGRFEIGEGSVSLSGDVSGIVGITQERLEGTLTACFSIEAMRKIVPRLLGEKIDVTPEVAADAMGEVGNMIFGRIKTDLNERGYQVRLSLPSVVRGSSHFINHLHGGRFMLVPFEIEGNVFQVHFAIHHDSAD